MLINILLIVVGLFAIVKPETMWKWENRFLAKQGDPSKTYMLLLRVAGVAMVVFGLLAILF